MHMEIWKNADLCLKIGYNLLLVKRLPEGSLFFVSFFHTTSQVSCTFCMKQYIVKKRGIDQTFSLQKNKV